MHLAADVELVDAVELVVIRVEGAAVIQMVANARGAAVSLIVADGAQSAVDVAVERTERQPKCGDRTL